MYARTGFNGEVDFCSGCGSLLPNLREKGDVACLGCALVVSGDDFVETEFSYTVKFNKIQRPQKKSTGDDGPVIERTCPKCNNDKMSFMTLQLRSADEGQTVFFTCTKCGYKEKENS